MSRPRHHHVRFQVFVSESCRLCSNPRRRVRIPIVRGRLTAVVFEFLSFVGICSPALPFEACGSWPNRRRLPDSLSFVFKSPSSCRSWGSSCRRCCSRPVFVAEWPPPSWFAVVGLGSTRIDPPLAVVGRDSPVVGLDSPMLALHSPSLRVMRCRWAPIVIVVVSPSGFAHRSRRCTRWTTKRTTTNVVAH